MRLFYFPVIGKHFAMGPYSSYAPAPGGFVSMAQGFSFLCSVNPCVMPLPSDWSVPLRKAGSLRWAKNSACMGRWDCGRAEATSHLLFQNFYSNKKEMTWMFIYIIIYIPTGKDCCWLMYDSRLVVTSWFRLKATSKCYCNLIQQWINSICS